MRHNVAWVFNLGAELYRWFTTQPTWQSSCRELAELLPTDASLRVVDIGCGPGGSTIELARARPNGRQHVARMHCRSRGCALMPAGYRSRIAVSTSLPATACSTSCPIAREPYRRCNEYCAREDT